MNRRIVEIIVNGEQMHMGCVIEYCAEEVHRQNHNLLTLDGIQRVGWMLNAWTYALEKSHKPTLDDAIALGRLIEPSKNTDGVRTCGVRVGSHRFPPAERVPQLLRDLWEGRDLMPPLEFYKNFELIHPFIDGNGRTGKILFNWLNESLLDPIFPPADLFGPPIANP